MTKLVIPFLALMSLFSAVEYASERGKEAYMREDFGTAYREYYQAKSEEWDRAKSYIDFNLGLSALGQDSMAKAMTHWRDASEGNPDYVASKACNNLGVAVMAQDTGDGRKKFLTAIEWLKDAMRKDPENLTARYNYELLMMNQPPPPQENPDSSQQDDSQQPPDPQEGDPQDSDPNRQPRDPQENSGQPGDPQERTGREEAEMKLKQMAKREKEFVQQLQKKNPHRTSKGRDSRNW